MSEVRMTLTTTHRLIHTLDQARVALQSGHQGSKEQATQLVEQTILDLTAVAQTGGRR